MTTLRIGIDVGGTFTDLVAVDVQSAERHALKVATTPRAPERGVLDALDALLTRYPVPPAVEYLAHSTTIATNALLGQQHLELPRVAFITTEGFRDLIEIGRQNRSAIYDLFVTRPRPLAARQDRLTVRERVAHDGRVLQPLQEVEIEAMIAALRVTPPGAIAIGFLNAYANDAHERRMAEAVARAFPELPITTSSEIDPEYREFERFSTAIVNAALMPIVRGYLERLERGLRDRDIVTQLYVMQSNGGMAAVAAIASRPAAIIESGPASGVIAAAHVARERSINHLLSFDMGGTTAKAGTIVDGNVHVTAEFEAAGSSHSGRSVKGSGYPVRFPFVDLAEVSAGGGTIAWVDESGMLRVGPLSAGSDPGPACYGASERATVTDANVVLGRLNQTHLAGGTFAIDAGRSRRAVAALASVIGISTHETAHGILRLIDSEMAKALRIVTVERGLDPRDFAMMAFGGNGPLHACALADELSISRIFIPARPGVFSADGLLVADLRAGKVHPLLVTTDAIAIGDLDRIFERLEATVRKALREQGAAEATIALVRTYDARYRGQGFELEIAHAPSTVEISIGFARAHRRRYGYEVAEEPVELVNLRVTGTAALKALPAAINVVAPRTASSACTRSVWTGDAFVEVPVYQRDDLPEQSLIRAPALIEQYDTCTYVAPGWKLLNDGDLLILERA